MSSCLCPHQTVYKDCTACSCSFLKWSRPAMDRAPGTDLMGAEEHCGKGCPKGLGEPPSYPLLAFDAGACMQGMQHFVTSGLHLLCWKEFKPFSCCCPFAVEASTWNRNKICNGFKITCFSPIPKNGNSFGHSLWRWGGLGILQRGHLRSLQIASTACS